MNYSKQREEILNYIKFTKSHPTAEMVYKEVKKRYPNISLGTVYRNLELLTKIGDIKRIEVKGSKDRFDADLSNHIHAICENCGMIYDVNVSDFEKVYDEIENFLNAKILSHNILINIKCSNCNYGEE